jgi:hypothetical protein
MTITAARFLVLLWLGSVVVGQEQFPDSWLHNDQVFAAARTQKLCVGYTVWSGKAAIWQDGCVELHNAPVLSAPLPDRIEQELPYDSVDCDNADGNPELCTVEPDEP